MKTKSNYLNCLLVFFLTVPLLTSSCRDDIDKGAHLSPSITAISPESGEPGSVVTITGTRFGTDPSNVSVRFNTTYVETIISVTDSEIKVEAPVGYSDQTVIVRLLVSDLSSNTVEFYYRDTEPPVITGMTETCFYNAAVIITGEKFSPNIEDNVVKFGEIEATVIEATRTSLTVIAPDLGDATDADVTVTKFDMVSNAETIAVDADQNKVATYDWTTHTVREGVTYKTATFSLFDDNERRIHILDVELNASNTLGIGVSESEDPSTFKSTVAICNDYAAVAGINAGYFWMTGVTADKDPFIRIDGEKVQDGEPTASIHFTDAALLIHNNVATVRRLGTSGNTFNQVAAAIPASEAENVIVSGPMLVTDGVVGVVNPDVGHNTSITGRTGLGVTADGERVFMVVVDTGGGVTGVSTPQLAKIMQALGAVNAMNFDGGGSSTMFVKDHGNNGLVNLPTGGTWQRPVRSVIYVK